MDKQYNAFEIAKIFGEPVDPRRLFPEVISETCETDTAEPSDYYYYFDALVDTDKIYVITANGELTQENVVPDSPTLLSFSDLASPEYYMKIPDLANSKEPNVIGRKLKTIDRALNGYETHKIISLAAAACQGTGNQITLGSGVDHFNYEHMVTMIHTIKDYSNDFVLLVGSTIDKDIDLWNWKDNKYSNLLQALADLNVKIVRVKQSITIDGSVTDVLSSTKAYLIGRNTEMGKPILFVRKKLNDIELLGGIIKEANGDKPQRIVFASPNPVSVFSGSKRYLAVGITGYEQIAAAVTNPYAIVEFSRV